MTALQYFPLILICVILNTISQLLLKMGMQAVGHFEFNLQNVPGIGWKVVTNYYILGGLSCYVISVVLWLLALSRMDVSVAYPMASLGYIATAIAGYFLLQEDLSLTKVLGILVIMIGVYLVSRS
jgi:multidrug transporter EmrE-like cation transporter